MSEAKQDAVAVTHEQDAFEQWAESAKYDMTQHPLHWLFLDAKTYHARQGWKAGLKFAQATATAPDEAQQVPCIFCPFTGTLAELKSHSATCPGHPAVLEAQRLRERIADRGGCEHGAPHGQLCMDCQGEGQPAPAADAEVMRTDALPLTIKCGCVIGRIGRCERHHIQERERVAAMRADGGSQ